MIKKIFRWIFPDASIVKSGTLWLANRRFYRDRYSSHDLIEVDDVCSNGAVLCSYVGEKKDNVYGFTFPRNSTCLMLTELVRNYKLTTKEDAAQLGFDV